MKGLLKRLDGAQLLGLIAGVFAWLGWFQIAPFLGFPRVRPAVMVNRVFLPDSDPEVWLGWVILALGLMLLGTLYHVAVASRRRGILFGFLFGAAAWAITGLALMPIMGWLSGPAPEVEHTMSSAPEAMPATFMMLHLGALAPLEALVAWLLFGGALAAASQLRRRLGEDGMRGARLQVQRQPP